jgi:hypothetical protein
MLIIIETVMQAMAVLLLEMAYEHKHLKEEKFDIATCIKRMIRWLHAMRENDPVASRAYDVVYKILKSCVPKLQDQVRDIMADDLMSVPSFQPYPATHHLSTAGGPSLIHRPPILSVSVLPGSVNGIELYLYSARTTINWFCFRQPVYHEFRSRSTSRGHAELMVEYSAYG